MVSSRAFPSLERKPGGPDNWVEATGGLPDYIERIAKHLHYEKGMSISHAIATAVNTVKRWARAGKVAKHGSKEHVSAKTVVQAQAAVAQWEAKRASARLNLSAILATDSVDLMEATMDLSALAERANAIADPVARGEARARVLDLAAMTKDGRKSFKNQGKWGHGFVPLDKKAKLAKAKGSPIAMQRMNRLFGGNTKGGLEKEGGGREAVKSIGQALHARVRDTRATHRTKPPSIANRPTVQKRSEQPWEKIPDTDKTIRNGKKYVMTQFKGKNVLTEYVGPNDKTVETTDKGSRLYKSVRPQELEGLTTGELRRLLQVPGQPSAVKKQIYIMIAKKQEAAK